MSKFDKVKDLSNDELKNKLKEIKQNLFDSAMKNSMGQLTNPLSIRHARREFARVRTAISQKSKLSGVQK